jgi:hypothetical protein
MLGKGLAVAVILLFVGVGVQPAVATVQPETEIDIEPKDYLFQTIIEIAKNPDFKNLLEQQSYDLFKIDIDRSICNKILLKSPRMVFSTLFIKPSISIEYLNKCYNNGIRISKFLGEEKVLEIMESVEVKDIGIYEKLNKIITEDEELSIKLETLKEMNRELNTKPLDWNFPIICLMLLITIIPYEITMLLTDWFNKYFDFFPLINSLMSLISDLFYIITYPINIIGSMLGCWHF